MKYKKRGVNYYFPEDKVYIKHQANACSLCTIDTFLTMKLNHLRLVL